MEEHEEAMGMLSQISAQDAGWLARHIRQCLKAECEHAGEEIARELEVKYGLFALMPLFK